MNTVKLLLAAGMILIFVCITNADFDVKTFVDNFDNYNDQSVLTGAIDSLAIIRGNFEFYLTDGELILLDFGSGIPCGLIFDGKINFRFTPPDEIERYQLHKFSGKDKLDCEFDHILMFYTVEIDDLPDTTLMSRNKLSKNTWYGIRDAKDDARGNFQRYIAANLVGDLLSDGPGSFIYADFYITRFDHMVFIEDPVSDDKYRLYKLLWVGYDFTRDVWSAYSDEHHLPSCRGYIPIDIKHYSIDSRIETGDKMFSNCRIEFTPVRWGQKYLQFNWYFKNKPLVAIDSRGDTLKLVHHNDCANFGIVLNQPLTVGENDYIDIEYESETLMKAWGFYFNRAHTYWYPRNMNYDKATFDFSFKCRDDFLAVASGELVESRHEDIYNYSKWRQDVPVSFISFELGLYDTEDFYWEGLPPVRIYNWKFKTRKERQEQTGLDVLAALNFYDVIFRSYPFDTLRVAEFPGFHGMGAPGLLHLTFLTTFSEFSSGKGAFEQFRAHEVAHQWFGHIVYTENYRDYWIIEGMAEYCGFLFYQHAFKNTEVCRNILKNWRVDVIEPDSKISVGSKAGPIVLGYRLSSSKSYDYNILVYEKSAYIFHMLRYLFRDFKTDSDDAFTNFLKDVVETYKNKPITTEGLRQILEKHLQIDMTWFFDQWVYGIDIPTYEFSYDYGKNPEAKYVVACHIKQQDVPDDFKMLVPLTVVFHDEKYAHFRYWIEGPETEIQLPPLPLEPERVDFNTYDAVLCRVKNK